MTIENLVKKFLNDEKFTLRNALAYAGLGLSKTGGEVNEIVADIAFNGHAYNDERQEHMAETLGEMMFYWHILVGSCGYTPDEVIAQYVNTFLIKNNQVTDEIKASLLELMKHVKSDVKTRDKLQYSKTRDGGKDQLQYIKTRNSGNDKVQTEPMQLDVSNKV